MMKQVLMKQNQQQQKQQHQQFEYSKDMTIKGKKNSKVKIVTNKRKINHWSLIFRRKRQMSEYFSDSAFGSQSDTKIELYNPRDDKEKMEKFRAMRILEYEYDENEIMPSLPTTTTISNIAFMNDPNTYSLNNKKENKG